MAPKLDTPAAGQADLPGPPEAAGQSQRRQLADRLTRANDSAPTLSELRKRAERLPPGHPSSPWNEDGSRRAPEKSPADYALPEPRLTDADYATHVKEVTARLDQARADGLATEKLYTIGPGHDGMDPGADRTTQDEIIEEIYARCRQTFRAKDWPSSLAVSAAPGRPPCWSSMPASTARTYLTINPDQFKENLPAAA